MSVWSIILTAGNGTRMNCDVNKTLLPLAGECSLSLCFRVLKRHCEGIIVVLRPEDRDHAIEMLRSHDMNADHYVFGGKNRQESVHKALPYLPDECDIVLIHDGARPLIDDNTVVNVIESTKNTARELPVHLSMIRSKLQTKAASYCPRLRGNPYALCRHLRDLKKV